MNKPHTIITLPIAGKELNRQFTIKLRFSLFTNKRIGFILLITRNVFRKRILFAFELFIISIIPITMQTKSMKLTGSSI